MLSPLVTVVLALMMLPAFAAMLSVLVLIRPSRLVSAPPTLVAVTVPLSN